MHLSAGTNGIDRTTIVMGPFDRLFDDPDNTGPPIIGSLLGPPKLRNDLLVIMRSDFSDASVRSN